mmetsp:Transcript_293/g.740  ORF Transcript_293/g.740 Transcript_293/m.740 type:complete len:270 (-) Transcript_293:56-865(-)
MQDTLPRASQYPGLERVMWCIVRNALYLKGSRAWASLWYHVGKKGIEESRVAVVIRLQLLYLGQHLPQDLLVRLHKHNPGVESVRREHVGCRRKGDVALKKFLHGTCYQAVCVNVEHFVVHVQSPYVELGIPYTVPLAHPTGLRRSYWLHYHYLHSRLAQQVGARHRESPGYNTHHIPTARVSTLLQRVVHHNRSLHIALCGHHRHIRLPRRSRSTPFPAGRKGHPPAHCGICEEGRHGSQHPPLLQTDHVAGNKRVVPDGNLGEGGEE